MGLFNWKNGEAGASPINATNLNLAQQQLVDTIYPVGSVYISINATDPKNLFGGTWERIKDTFLLSAGDTYSAGSTGGEAKHILTEAEMPRHIHEVIYNDSNTSGFASFPHATNGYGTQKTASECGFNALRPSGGDEPHNNMPPYLAVYMWKRTA